MTRIIIAVVLIVLGVVGIAGGIWGFSLRIGSDVDPKVLDAARTVLTYADDAVGQADSWLSGVTGGKASFTDIVNNMVGGNIDLTSDVSVSYFACMHALEILLFGIIGVETGLLLFRFG